MNKLYNLNLPESLKASVTDDAFLVHCAASKNEMEPVELLIMEEIGESFFGDGVSAKSVASFLASNRGRDVNVRINSPGGLVYDGLTIYNALASHDAPVTVIIEGLAYSAASFIAMAGDVIKMHENSDIGIHRAWVPVVGNAKALRAAAEWADTVDGHLVDIYAGKSGASRELVNDWLDGTDDGTLFSAKDALAVGLVDEVIPMKRAIEQVKTAASRRIAASHTARLARIKRT